jgi:DNA-binding NtrC family response regulator
MKMNNNQETILIIDDKADCHDELKRFLKQESYRIISIYDPDEWETVCNEGIDLAFLDIRFDNDEIRSFQLLKKLCTEWSDIPVVMISSYGDIPKAVRATKIGAFDFLEKGTYKRDDILKVVRNALDKRRLSKENARLRKLIVGQKHLLNTKYPEIVGESPKISEVLNSIEILSQSKSDVPVLIFGESGTGKQLVAEAIHRNSHRANGPFIDQSVLDIPREGNLTELELFGRVKGYPNIGDNAAPGLFEKADKGTLFLDEIAGVPLEVQQRFLKTLQEKFVIKMGDTKNTPINVDFRLITATNRDLKQEVGEGRFREDLFYRISVFLIVLPPLRERKEDIPALLYFFLHKYGQNQVDSISDEVLGVFMKYNWPGNVRELAHVVEASIPRTQYAKRKCIEIEDLPPYLIGEISNFENQCLIIPEELKNDVIPPSSPKKCSLEERSLLLALKEITQIKRIDISTNDIKEAMIPYLPEAIDFKGRRIGSLLRKLGLVTKENTKRAEVGYVYTILPEKIQVLIEEREIQS